MPEGHAVRGGERCRGWNWGWVRAGQSSQRLRAETVVLLKALQFWLDGQEARLEIFTAHSRESGSWDGGEKGMISGHWCIILL